MTEDSETGNPRKQALDIVDVLLDRSDVVESLLEEPKSKRDLVEDTDVSRSTVDRATKELETAGLIDMSTAVLPSRHWESFLKLRPLTCLRRCV